MLMIVVLPAPLGPMQAVTFPGGISIDTSSKTKTPPKFIASRSMRSPLFAKVMVAYKAAPPEDHQADQEKTIHCLLQRPHELARQPHEPQRFVESGKQDDTEHRARGARKPAYTDIDQDEDRGVEGEQRRINVEQRRSVEAAGEPGERPRESPNDHLIVARILAERGKCVRPVARRPQRAPKRRRHNTLAQEHAGDSDGERGNEPRTGRGEKAGQLQTVEPLAAFHAWREIAEYVEEDEVDAERRQGEIEAADAQEWQQRDGGRECACDRSGKEREVEIDAEQDIKRRRHIGAYPEIGRLAH